MVAERPPLARGDSQTLAALGAAALENDAAVLCTHAHPEPVSSTAAAAIWLKRALHWTPGWGDSPAGETWIVTNEQKTCQFELLVCKHDAVVNSPAFANGPILRRKFSTPVQKPVEIS
jgi:hypothetical protein